MQSLKRSLQMVIIGLLVSVRSCNAYICARLSISRIFRSSIQTVLTLLADLSDSLLQINIEIQLCKNFFRLRYTFSIINPFLCRRIRINSPSNRNIVRHFPRCFPRRNCCKGCGGHYRGCTRLDST